MNKILCPLKLLLSLRHCHRGGSNSSSFTLVLSLLQSSFSAVICSFRFLLKEFVRSRCVKLKKINEDVAQLSIQCWWKEFARFSWGSPSGDWLWAWFDWRTVARGCCRASADGGRFVSPPYHVGETAEGVDVLPPLGICSSSWVRPLNSTQFARVFVRLDLFLPNFGCGICWRCSWSDKEKRWYCAGITHWYF